MINKSFVTIEKNGARSVDVLGFLKSKKGQEILKKCKKIETSRKMNEETKERLEQDIEMTHANISEFERLAEELKEQGFDQSELVDLFSRYYGRHTDKIHADEELDAKWGDFLDWVAGWTGNKGLFGTRQEFGPRTKVVNIDGLGVEGLEKLINNNPSWKFIACAGMSVNYLVHPIHLAVFQSSHTAAEFVE